jgi:CHAD domain-containing protein
MNRELALRFNDESMSDQIKEIKKLQEQIGSLDDLILNWDVIDIDTITNILVGIEFSLAERLRIIDDLQMQKAALDFKEGFDYEVMP